MHNIKLQTTSKLFAAGLSIDMNEECFGTMQPSTDIVADIKALQKRMDKEGYIFLPSFFEANKIMDVRKVFVEELEQQNIIDNNWPIIEAKAHPELPLSCRPVIGTYDNPTLDALVHSGPIIELLNKLLEGPVRYFEYTWYRAIPPGKGTRPHCDIVYMGRGTKNIFTVWIPIGHIPLHGSGLIILENSHYREDLLNSYLECDVDEHCINSTNNSSSLTGSTQQWDGALSDNPIKLREVFGGRWLASEFFPGDIVIFTAQTVHGSLDNCSDKIRLSVDCRYQLSTDQLDERWVGKQPIGRGQAGKRIKIC